MLAYLQTNPETILLLDEPDAHLEILRQRQTYEILCEASERTGSQIIAASHSEVVLNEAAERDVVVAFVGRPHRIDNRRRDQVRKSLADIGYEAYAQAEQTGWVLYLEGSTDLAILRAFADTLGHPAHAHLERPFVHYVQNRYSEACRHFFGVREAFSDLPGIVVLDRQLSPPVPNVGLPVYLWQRAEIENYLCMPEVLRAYARDLATREHGPLFQRADADRLENTMNEQISRFVPPIALDNPDDAFWITTKATDQFLDRVFPAFFEAVALPNLMRKSDYFELARLVPRELIQVEVVKMLTQIAATAQQAAPLPQDEGPEQEPTPPEIEDSELADE